MESSEASPPKTEIELALNEILDDISKVLKEYKITGTVKAYIEVKIELTPEQTLGLPTEVQEDLKAPKSFSCRFDKYGHPIDC